MKMTMKKKDLVILIYVAGILIAVLVYFLYFSPILESNSQTEMENATLQSQYSSLAALKAKQSEYEAKTVSEKNEMSKMLDEFPGGLQAEDEIMYARKLESDYGLSISNVGVSDPQMVYSLSQGAADGTADTATASTTSAASTSSADTTESDAAAAATDSGTTVTGTLGGNAANQAAAAVNNASSGSTEDTGVLYSSPLNLTFTSTYQGFKDMLYSIATSDEKQSIETASASFDTTTGELMGTVVINKFYMTGTNKSYSSVNIPDVSVGTQNIFGTVTPPAEETTAQEETAPTA